MSHGSGCVYSSPLSAGFRLASGGQQRSLEEGQCGPSKFGVEECSKGGEEVGVGRRRSLGDVQLVEALGADEVFVGKIIAVVVTHMFVDGE